MTELFCLLQTVHALSRRLLSLQALTLKRISVQCNHKPCSFQSVSLTQCLRAFFEILVTGIVRYACSFCWVMMEHLN